MYTKEDVSFALFKQTAFGADPAAPNGILLPRDANFNVQHKRNALDNPQVQADGFEREFALGNHTVELTGDLVPNLNFWPWVQRWLTGELTTAGAGPYTHTSLLKRTPIYHLVEMGMPAATLYYKYRDLLLNKCSFDLPIEGICKVSLGGVGSGDAVFAGVAPLDATVTEVAGAPGEYANMTILEDAVDIGTITKLGIEIARAIVEKRPHGKGGKASELRFGADKVSGTLEVYFETDALWAKARGGTLTALSATLVSGADSLAITMPEVKLEPVGPAVEGDDGIMQSFTYRAIKKASADAPIKFVTTNAVAGAAYA